MAYTLFSFSEDFSTIVVLSCDVLEPNLQKREKGYVGHGKNPKNEPRYLPRPRFTLERSVQSYEAPRSLKSFSFASSMEHARLRLVFRGRRHQKSYVPALLTMSWEWREKTWFTALNAGLTMLKVPQFA